MIEQLEPTIPAIPDDSIRKIDAEGLILLPGVIVAQKCVVNAGFFIGATAERLPDLLTANPMGGIKINHDD
jgi:hypothetical protein